ncbi:hypothetical protein HMI54_001905 [Coelomomyces lativittatus]|nr:hypothetical protein HMI56_004249 [Coelomomyces lativittatus]KAJ1506862.1 hypothetical protein HMI55_001000 [Coelomomyces lativittatus]KAJ1510016.1 hypothetical protein HMI54_001905 [Coelomomyces lativittatus]
MPPPKFGFGLNVAAKHKRKAFDDSEPNVEDTPVNPTTTTTSTYLSSVYQKNVEELQQSALEQDPTVFEYDTIYDAMKEKNHQEKNLKKMNNVKESQPKYVESLIRNAQLRKLDQFRVERRKREKEMEEDASLQSKEVFITNAYKETLEKVKQLEKEEEEREKQDAFHRSKFGLSGFFHTYLASTHRDTSSLPITPLPTDTHSKPPSSSQTLLPVDIPTHVPLNVSGDIVDKRDLLQSGLNVVRQKPTITSTSPPVFSKSSSPSTVSLPPSLPLHTTSTNQSHIQEAKARYLARRAAKTSNSSSSVKEIQSSEETQLKKS